MAGILQGRLNSCLTDEPGGGSRRVAPLAFDDLFDLPHCICEFTVTVVDDVVVVLDVVEFRFEKDTVNRAKEIVLVANVDLPMSPKSVGLGSDERLLGAGVEWAEIGWRPEFRATSWPRECSWPRRRLSISRRKQPAP